MLITISAFSLYGSISTPRRLGADMEPDSENAEIVIGKRSLLLVSSGLEMQNAYVLKHSKVNTDALKIAPS